MVSSKLGSLLCTPIAETARADCEDERRVVERDDTQRRMDELLALQQELANVQSAKAGFKLSEPNVVEVVQKMVEMGLLEVLYTSNGKEYVTPKRLHEEVADEILAHGGRINITELPPILNVDLPHIERAVDQLLKNDGSLQLLTALSGIHPHRLQGQGQG